MKKSNYYLPQLFLLFALPFLITSCSKKDTEGPKATVSIESANFTSYSVGTHELNWSILTLGSLSTVQIAGYNSDYNYTLKLVGRYYKKEYTLALKAKSTQPDDGKSPYSSGATTYISETDNRVTLDVIITSSLLEIDEYIAYIVEKESNTEIKIKPADALSTRYETFVVDNRAPDFLGAIHCTELPTYVVIASLDVSDSGGGFRIKPRLPDYINGIAVELAVYDLKLNKIGVASYNGSNGSTTFGTYSYRYSNSAMANLIPSSGEYLLRFEEVKNPNLPAGKIYKKGVFLKIKITK